MTSVAARLNKKDMTKFADETYRCSGYQQNNPSLHQAAKLYNRDAARLSKPQDQLNVLKARSVSSDLGTRAENWVTHFRRNMDYTSYKRIVAGFSTPALAEEAAIFAAITEPYRGALPEHLRYNVSVEGSNEATIDTRDISDKTILKRQIFAAFAHEPDQDSYLDRNCLHIVLSYRHEHPIKRKCKGYAHRQRVAESVYRDIAANIASIATTAGMTGVRVWTDQHYAIRRATEQWIEEALFPFAMYQVYYHNAPSGEGQAGDETRAWIFAEHTFAMLGFGLCANVVRLPGSWEMYEADDSLMTGRGRMQVILNLLSMAGARIQCHIGDLSAYNEEDVDLIKKWSLSVNLYGSFYEDDSLQGRRAVDGLEWVALANVARNLNPVSIAMRRPIPGEVYSSKEQLVVVSSGEGRSWNGISEFSGGSLYDTSTDKHLYVCGRFALRLQLRVNKVDAQNEDGGSRELYLLALITTSGHLYNVVEAFVRKGHTGEKHGTRVLQWRRLSELEIVRRRSELLDQLGVPLDNPDRTEISRRWRTMDLPGCDDNSREVERNWY